MHACTHLTDLHMDLVTLKKTERIINCSPRVKQYEKSIKVRISNTSKAIQQNWGKNSQYVRGKSMFVERLPMDYIRVQQYEGTINHKLFLVI